jgi:hypothetical protein
MQVDVVEDVQGLEPLVHTFEGDHYALPSKRFK